jgi:hypothetical protein
MADMTFPNLEAPPMAKKKPSTFEKEIQVMEGLPEPERPVSHPPPSIVAPEPDEPAEADEDAVTDEISVLDEVEETTTEITSGEIAEATEPEAKAPPAAPKPPAAPPPRDVEPDEAPTPPPPPSPSAPPVPPPAPGSIFPEPEPPGDDEPVEAPEPSGRVALPGGPDLPELPRDKEPDLAQLSASEPHPVASPVEERPRGSKLKGCLVFFAGLLVGGLIGGGVIALLFSLGLFMAGGTEESTEPPEVAAVEPAEEPPEKPAEEPAEKPAEEPAEKPAEEPSEKAPPPEPAAEAKKLAYTAKASSFHKKYPPKNLYDGKLSTVWQEDRKTKAENHVLTFAFEKPVHVAKIGVIIGYDHKDRSKGDLWPLNNRLKTAVAEFPDGTKTVLDFEDDVREMQFKELESPGPVSEFTLKVLECYRGTWFRDNAIPEIEIWGTP